MVKYLVPIINGGNKEYCDEECFEAEIACSLDEANRYILIIVETSRDNVKELTVINMPKESIKDIKSLDINYIFLKKCTKEVKVEKEYNVIYTDARTLDELLKFLLYDMYKEI